MFTSWVSSNFFLYFSLGITVNVRLQSKLCMISESTAFVEVHESWAFFKLWLNLLQKLAANLGSFPSLAMNPFPLVSHLSSWIVTICSTEARQLFRFKDVASWWLKTCILHTSLLCIRFPSVQKNCAKFLGKFSVQLSIVSLNKICESTWKSCSTDCPASNDKLWILVKLFSFLFYLKQECF